jgi:hypothetical protein
LSVSWLQRSAQDYNERMTPRSSSSKGTGTQEILPLLSHPSFCLLLIRLKCNYLVSVRRAGVCCIVPVRTGARHHPHLLHVAHSFEVCQYSPGFILGMCLIICFSPSHVVFLQSKDAARSKTAANDRFQYYFPACKLNRFNDLGTRSLHLEHTKIDRCYMLFLDLLFTNLSCQTFIECGLRCKKSK